MLLDSDDEEDEDYEETLQEITDPLDAGDFIVPVPPKIREYVPLPEDKDDQLPVHLRHVRYGFMFTI